MSCKGINTGPKSEEAKQHMRKPKSNEHKNKLKISALKRFENPEERQKLRIIALNRKKEKCVFCGKKCQSAPLKRWHNENCKLNIPQRRIK